MFKHLIPISLACLVFTASAVCAAEKIAVLPVSYRLAEGGDGVPEAVAKVEAKVLEGIEQAGFEVIDGARVTAAVAKTAAGGRCEDRDCLTAVAGETGADEALKLVVVDEDRTSYRVRLVLARRDEVQTEKTAGFFVVLEWLRGTVALTLQKAVTPPAATVEQPDVLEGEGDTGEPKQVEAEAAPEEPAEGPGEVVPPVEKDGLTPVPFYVSAAVSGALLLSWGITDIVVHSRFKDLEEGDDMDRDTWIEKRDSAKSLQTADRVLLGFAAAGVVTTGVLFFLTDFGKDAERPEVGISSLAPVVTEGGGGLTITGDF